MLKANNKIRDLKIDFLRCSAIITIVLIHTTREYGNYLIPYFFWNYSHFAIITFIFCSGASLAITYDKIEFKNFQLFFKFVKKRFLRLSIPYVEFLAIYLTISFVTNNKLKFIYLNYGWLLTVIFILSLFYPFLQYLTKKIPYKNILILSILLSLIFNIYFIQNIIHWEILFIIQTIFVFFLGIYYSNFKDKKKINYLVISYLALSIYLMLSISFLILNKSIVLIDNKYPPNFLYISYGVFITSLLLSLVSKHELKNKRLIKITLFFSKNSLWLFLWHILVINLINVYFKIPHGQLSWVIKFIIVLIISSFLIIIQNYLKGVLKNIKKSFL